MTNSSRRTTRCSVAPGRAAGGVDTTASPGLKEVMPVRRHHQQAVRETLENLTDAGLAGVRAAPDAPGHPLAGTLFSSASTSS